VLEVPEGNVLALALAAFAFAFGEFGTPGLFIQICAFVPVGDLRVVVGVLGSGLFDDLRVRSRLRRGSRSRREYLVRFSVGALG
jgi:hypothetical protein